MPLRDAQDTFVRLTGSEIAPLNESRWRVDLELCRADFTTAKQCDELSQTPSSRAIVKTQRAGLSNSGSHVT
jgi:hypothetical protein